MLASHFHALGALGFASTFWAVSALMALKIAQTTAAIIPVVPLLPLSLYFLKHFEILIFFLSIYLSEGLLIVFDIF
jgi:hypothetical protein